MLNNCLTVSWGSVADWVSGIGSLSAAIVALYLARWSQRIRLRGYCGLRVIAGENGPIDEVLFINVTNIGTRSTIVGNIGMKVGLFQKRFAIIPMVKDQYSVGIPYPITDGQQAHWALPLDKRRTWLRDLCKDFVLTTMDVRTLRIQIYTTHGETFNIRPEFPLRKAILEIISKKHGLPVHQTERLT